MNTKTPKGNEQTDAVYSYNTADQVDYFSPGSIGTIDYDYNKYRGWLKDVIHSGGMFTEYLRFSASGNIDTQKVHNVGNGTWGDYTYAFTYDDMNRLTNAASTIPDNSESYTYNGDGRIMTKNRTNNILSMTAVNGTNRINSVGLNGSNYSFAYDTKGNVTNDGLGGIIMSNYNHSNLPLTTNNMQYVYNDNGERIKKQNVDSMQTDYYLRDYLGRELVVYNYETNDPKEINIFGSGLVGKIELTDSTVDRYYYLKDHLGSVRTVLDANSNVVSAMDYYPYGELLREYCSNTSDYLFTETERDHESNYNYMNARYYDSKLGIWLSVDPLADLFAEQSPFLYSFNNPLRYSDKYGLAPTDTVYTSTLPEISVTPSWEPSSWFDIFRLFGNTLFGYPNYYEYNIKEDWSVEKRQNRPMPNYNMGVVPDVGIGLKGGKNLSAGLKGLFQGGSVKGLSLIEVRMILFKNGFKVSKADGVGYLFKNQLGEEVRIMFRNGRWDLRVMNKYGNYLDEFGNVPKNREGSHNLFLQNK